MNQLNKKAFSIKEFSEVVSLGKTRIYEEIKSGRLKVCKIGRRTIITDQAADEWLQSLPEGGE